MSSTLQQPYVKCSTAPLDAISGAAGYLRKHWGDYGYTMGVEASTFGAYLFACRASDGSEFFLISDSYGNVSEAEWDGAKFKRVNANRH